MPKNKRPQPRKSAPSTEEQEDALMQKFCDLAVDLAEQEDSAAMSDALRQKDSELHKLVKKSLYQKKDDILYEALERAKDADIGAYLLLKERIEEASSVVVTGQGGKNVEINAFVIPLFARTVGGLDRARCFQDQTAFEALTKSLQEAQLESPDATVVLINHAYHLDEIDGITFSHLNDMVREAHASMTDMRGAATPAIERSMAGWPESHFGPDDQAVELRFLLGFALKTTDDAFYRVPEDEAAADAYFETRAARFERWAQQSAPLVQHCLGSEGEQVEVNFLYQDLFHGGKERGIAEYLMLQTMSELNHGLEQHGADPAGIKAIIGPIDLGDETALRVNLYAVAGDAVLATADKAWDIARDLETEIADLQDALDMIGVTTLSVAAKFSADGQAIGVRSWPLGA